MNVPLSVRVRVGMSIKLLWLKCCCWVTWIRDGDSRATRRRLSGNATETLGQRDGDSRATRRRLSGNATETLGQRDGDSRATRRRLSGDATETDSLILLHVCLRIMHARILTRLCTCSATTKCQKATQREAATFLLHPPLPWNCICNTWLCTNKAKF